MKVYVDTSVYGGVYDEEFSLYSDLFFKMIIETSSIIYVSDVVFTELSTSPEWVRQVLVDLPFNYKEHLPIQNATLDLANKYIAEGVVGQTSLADCIHIALATINKADLLVSWNFKHIVNVHRIKGYNNVNLSQGYDHLEIRNPREAFDYEN